MPGPEVPAPQAGDVEAAAAAAAQQAAPEAQEAQEVAARHDAAVEELLDPNSDLSGRTVVRPTQGEVPPAQTSHREGYWAEPTQGQVDKAAQYGFDLTQQEKYR